MEGGGGGETHVKAVVGVGVCGGTGARGEAWDERTKFSSSVEGICTSFVVTHHPHLELVYFCMYVCMYVFWSGERDNN